MLYGGTGRDVLIGGTDADRFVFEFGDSVRGKVDVIGRWTSFAAFEFGLDVIDPSAIDADRTLAGDQAFGFDGTTGIGHIWLITGNESTIVLGDTDGTGGPDLALVIRDKTVDHSAYSQTDFVL